MVSVGTVISYPIPLYSNLPIEAQFYQPSRFVISAITLSTLTITVTTTADNNYVVGQLVRLIIPPSFGSRGLNERKGYVLSIPASNQVTLDISGQGIDPYIASTATTVAQIIAIGDINSGIISSTGTVIPTTNVPGAFINISPN